MATIKTEPDLNKLAEPKLLEVIDKLFELNIGEFVALPQVIQPYTNSVRG